MKKTKPVLQPQPSKPKPTLSKRDRNLFIKAKIFSESDLCEARIETEARKTLAALRKSGFQIADHDLYDDTCLCCLDSSLWSAVELSKTVMSR